MGNPCLTAARAELERAGIRDVEVAYGGKHARLRFRSSCLPCRAPLAIGARYKTRGMTYGGGGASLGLSRRVLEAFSGAC